MRIDIKFYTRQVSVMFDDKVIDFGLAEKVKIKDADSSIDSIKDAVIVALCREKAWNDSVELVDCDSPICKYCALCYNKESQEDEDDCMMCQSYPGHQYFIGIECFRTLGD